MPLKLTRPLLTLDTETTGPQPAVDRICEIGIVKRYPDGKETQWRSLVNPLIPISAFISKIHGITDEDVKTAPTFGQLASKLAKGFLDVDFCGYNLEFDLNFLIAEFERIHMPHTLRDVRIADVFEVYKIKRPRTLSAAIKEVLKREHEGAHGALADAQGTLDLLDGLIEMYPDLPDTVDGLHSLVYEQIPEGYLDRKKRIAWIDGVATLAFGKHQGRALKDIPNGYLEWMLNGNFPLIVKQIIEKALAGEYPTEQEWKDEI